MDTQTINPAERLQKFSALPDSLKILYSSPKAAQMNRTLANKYAVSDEHFDPFIDVIGDVILGISSTAKLPEQLVRKAHVSEENARKITSELIEYLSPVIQTNKAPEQPGAKPTNSTPGTLPTPQKEQVPKPVTPEHKATQPVVQKAPAQKSPENAPSSESVVQPIRTMQGDVDRVHGYGAYQKMFPEKNTPSKAPEPKNESDEPVVTATPQSEVLKKDGLAHTPSYSDQNPPQNRG